MARSASAEPLEKFRFLVSWTNDGSSEKTALARAGFHDIQMPKRSTTKGTYREGTDNDINQLFAGLSSMEDITLSRGIAILDNDKSSDFYQWASAVHKPSSGNPSNNNLRPSNSASNEYKKDLTIKMLDREGVTARTWILYNAFPVNFVPGSDLNASEDGEKSMEQLTLAYEDFKEVKADGVTDRTVSASL